MNGGPVFGWTPVPSRLRVIIGALLGIAHTLRNSAASGPSRRLRVFLFRVDAADRPACGMDGAACVLLVLVVRQTEGWVLCSVTDTAPSQGLFCPPLPSLSLSLSLAQKWENVRSRAPSAAVLDQISGL